MSIFKPTRNADFLRSRTLFFVVALVLHFIWSIVAALDVSSKDARQNPSHIAVAAYNLGIQAVSFGTMSFVSYVDSRTPDQRSAWYTHVFFEIVLCSVLAVLQLAGALAYSALAQRFDCSANNTSSCSTAIRAILVGNWTITLLYIIFTGWFTTSAVLAAKRDPTVWRSRSRTFDWEAERHPSLITPSSPLDIIGVEKRQTTPVSKPPRKTWVLPLSRHGPRPRVESTPHLPIQNLPPPTPFEPVPAIPEHHHLALARQSIPEDISLSETPDDLFRSVPLPEPLPVHQQKEREKEKEKDRNKFMSIKPLKLHRARGSVDKSSIGLPKAITAGRSTLGESKFMSLTAVESQFQHWWEPESSFARHTPRFPSGGGGGGGNGAPTISSRSRYSTGTTVPPTPPPKDAFRLPLSATITATSATSTSPTSTSNPFRTYPDRRAMVSPPPRVTSPVSRVTSPLSRVTSPSPVPPRVTSPVPRGYI